MREFHKKKQTTEDNVVNPKSEETEHCDTIGGDKQTVNENVEVEDAVTGMQDKEADDDSTGSVYYNSLDIGSYYSDEDEKAQRKSSTKIRFDEDALMPMFFLGMIFKYVHQE